MKRRDILAALFVIGMVAAPIAACTHDETAGQYIDDSVISNKVRAKLLDDKDLNIVQIDVTTLKGVVALNGFVSNGEAKARATRVASTVEGVRQVSNNLVVR